MEDWGVDDRLRVLVVIAEDVLAFGQCDRSDQCRVWVVSGVVGEVVERVINWGIGCNGINGRSSPHISLRKRFQVKARHNTEVVATTPQGEIEIRVWLLIHIGNLAVGKYHLGAQLATSRSERLHSTLLGNFWRRRKPNRGDRRRRICHL